MVVNNVHSDKIPRGSTSVEKDVSSTSGVNLTKTYSNSTETFKDGELEIVGDTCEDSNNGFSETRTVVIMLIKLQFRVTL